MSFAFSNIILNRAPLSYNAGRLYINGSGLAFASEAAGSVTGLTVESGDSRYVSITGNQQVLGKKSFPSGIFDSSNHLSIDPENRTLSLVDGTISVDWAVGSLNGPGSIPLVSWTEGLLIDYSTQQSLDWENRTIDGLWAATSTFYAQDGIESSGNIVVTKGNPRIQLRDTSAGGHSQGFDIHTSTGRFYIDDNTHSLSFFDYNFSSNVHTLSLNTNEFQVATAPSGNYSPTVSFRVDRSGNAYFSGIVFIPSGASSSGHAVNYHTLTGYSYPRSNPSGYLAGVPSDVVRTSGNQIISGVKAFVGEASFSAISAMDGASALSIDCSQRFLYDNLEEVSIDYQNRVLSGDWHTNTNPIDSLHVANVGWVSGWVGSNSTLVKTTGVQHISDTKHFFELDAGKSVISEFPMLSVTYGELSIYEPNHDNLIFSAAFDAWNDLNGVASCNFESRQLLSGSNVSIDWKDKTLNGAWTVDSNPTATGGIATKAYVDSLAGGVYTVPFGHALQATVADSTTYYFGGCQDAPPQTTASSASVVPVPQSGVLRKIVGNASVPGTLSSAENVSLVVYINGSAVATGTYQTTGRNNTIFSGLQNIDRNISALDTIQLSMMTPAWTTNPTNLRQSAVAYISLS